MADNRERDVKCLMSERTRLIVERIEAAQRVRFLEDAIRLNEAEIRRTCNHLWRSEGRLGGPYGKTQFRCAVCKLIK